MKKSFCSAAGLLMSGAQAAALPALSAEAEAVLIKLHHHSDWVEKKTDKARLRWSSPLNSSLAPPDPPPALLLVAQVLGRAARHAHLLLQEPGHVVARPGRGLLQPPHPHPPNPHGRCSVFVFQSSSLIPNPCAFSADCGTHRPTRRHARVGGRVQEEGIHVCHRHHEW